MQGLKILLVGFTPKGHEDKAEKAKEKSMLGNLYDHFKVFSVSGLDQFKEWKDDETPDFSAVVLAQDVQGFYLEMTSYFGDDMPIFILLPEHLKDQLAQCGLGMMLALGIKKNPQDVFLIADNAVGQNLRGKLVPSDWKSGNPVGQQNLMEAGK